MGKNDFKLHEEKCGAGVGHSTRFWIFASPNLTNNKMGTMWGQTEQRAQKKRSQQFIKIVVNA